MFTRRFGVVLLAAIPIAIPLPTRAQEKPATFQVTGAVKQILTLSAADLATMPRSTVRTTSNGTEIIYEGVWLHEILKKAGVPLGSELRGKALATYVLAEAQDGYRVVFSLGELDPSFIDSEILIADTANGKPLSGPQGQFRLVVPKDKMGSRSVRMLTKLEVVQVTQ